ncbi:MAG: hypothetical protein COB16_01400 [Rhodobacteraceae bacterium]|nr:MAG: hypothetical protein COB16_01400 [Paracoccaceae bacterium]
MKTDETGHGKIFCLGFPKTGTTSLEVALQHLGYKVCRGNGRNNHTNYLIALFVHREYDELRRMIRHFDAFADLPWGGTDFYLWLSETYPEARFIQTIREPQAWFRSLSNAAHSLDENSETALESTHAAGHYGAVYLFNKVWQIHSMAGAKERLLEIYGQLNSDIESHFAGQDRFFSFALTQERRWDELCDFLDKKVPDRPFPLENPSQRSR